MYIYGPILPAVSLSVGGRVSGMTPLQIRQMPYINLLKVNKVILKKCKGYKYHKHTAMQQISIFYLLTDLDHLLQERENQNQTLAFVGKHPNPLCLVLVKIR